MASRRTDVRATAAAAAAQTARLAAWQMGPVGLCGAHTAPCVRAARAIASMPAIPPAYFTSGITTSYAPASRYARNAAGAGSSSSPASRIPRAFARARSRFRSGIAAGLSTIGHSNQVTPRSASASPTSAASAGGNRQWQSTMSSCSGPSNSLTAATRSSPVRTRRLPDALVALSGVRSSNGAIFKAVKPAKIASRALAAKPAGVRSSVRRLMFA